MLLDVIRRHGLPAPVPQHVVRDEHGQFVARVDLAYPDRTIAIEYDSYQEHVGKAALVRDSRRRNALVGARLDGDRRRPPRTSDAGRAAALARRRSARAAPRSTEPASK